MKLRKFNGFDKNKNLPPGVYNMTLSEVEELFSKNKSEMRNNILTEYKKHLKEIKNMGYCLEHWIDGSFVTLKENPNDIDTLTEFDGIKIDESNNRNFVDNLIKNSKENTNNLCHSLKVYKYPPEQKEDYIRYINQKRRILFKLFGKDRKNNKKGFVRLIGVINMLFSTLEEYNKELNDMEHELKETEDYLKKHPQKHGTRGNYETLKYLHDLFYKDKIDFINNVNNFNLKLLSELKALPITKVNTLNNQFNIATISSTNLLENNGNYQENLLVKEISQGSYKITYSFQNPTEEDVLRKSPRKKGLMKIFDFINCGDDIEKLKKEAGHNGCEALKNYKSFLLEIVNLNADFTLDTEMGTVKAGLTLQQCKNICENLNI